MEPLLPVAWKTRVVPELRDPLHVDVLVAAEAFPERARLVLLFADGRLEIRRSKDGSLAVATSLGGEAEPDGSHPGGLRGAFLARRGADGTFLVSNAILDREYRFVSCEVRAFDPGTGRGVGTWKVPSDPDEIAAILRRRGRPQRMVGPVVLCPRWPATGDRREASMSYAIWDLGAEGGPLPVIAEAGPHLSVSRDRRYLVYTQDRLEDGRRLPMILMEPESGTWTELHPPPLVHRGEDHVTALSTAFSPDGRLLHAAWLPGQGLYDLEKETWTAWETRARAPAASRQVPVEFDAEGRLLVGGPGRTDWGLVPQGEEKYWFDVLAWGSNQVVARVPHAAVLDPGSYAAVADRVGFLDGDRIFSIDVDGQLYVFDAAGLRSPSAAAP